MVTPVNSEQGVNRLGTSRMEVVEVDGDGWSGWSGYTRER